MLDIVVVGGGTAGWLSALFLQKTFPHFNITVIASSEIGVLGAGEGGAPPFKFLMDYLNISNQDLILNARATVKNGIKFTNWNGDGTHYYHGFLDHPEYDANVVGKHSQPNISSLFVDEIANGKDLESLNFTGILSEQGLCKYKADSLEKIGLDAIHFDASLLAKYFQQVGLQRGITLIDDKVVNINSDVDNYITSFDLASGINCTADFVFDCSGFARLILGKFYNVQWKSYKDMLPVKRAMPFFIDNTGDIPPYTEAVALGYGWMWRIPVQGRFGCGYAFDSDYITDERAKQEVENYLGHSVTVPKMFSFEAGYYENVCVKNCMGIGLSTGFIEPTEATSISAQVQSLKYFGEMAKAIFARNDRSIALINQKVKELNEHILNFIYIHYYTSKRNDTAFWKDFTTKNKMPIQAAELIEHITHHTPTEEFFKDFFTKYPDPIFPSTAWYIVLAGVRALDPALAKSVLDSLDLSCYNNVRSEYLNHINETSVFISHKDYLNRMLA